MRDLLEELAGKNDRGALLDVVFGVLQKAEKVIEDQAIETSTLHTSVEGWSDWARNAPGGHYSPRSRR